MSLQSFKEKLRNLNGEYTLNFANEDDCAYFLEEYGGEEQLRKKSPAIHDCFVHTKKMARQRMMQNNNDADVKLCKGHLQKLTIEHPANQSGALQQTLLKNNGADPYVCLSAALDFDFVDGTKKVRDDEPAEEWIGVTVQTKIKEINAPQYIVNDNFALPAVQSFNGIVKSRLEKLSVLNNKRYSILVKVQGRDPSGELKNKIFKKEQNVGDVKYFTIADIKIDDPAPKNNTHKDRNEIMMLYGRLDQQQIFKNADYKDGDYLKNNFKDGRVHLLMPIKGELVYDYNVQPKELTRPNDVEILSRSQATYEYKEQVFTYRSDITDDNILYEKLKSCFSQDEYKPQQRTKVYFDFRIADSGRSDLDWHTDIEGIANGEPKTILVDGCFTYSSINQLGMEVEDQILIKGITKEDLIKQQGKQYYVYVAGTNTIYIPPVTVYWGCFGRDVKIRLADKTEKNACDIAIGDQLEGYDHKILKVNNIITGHDTTIYLIKTKENGEIKVSGGHPMLCNGQKIRACRIKQNDKLHLADGSLAEVESVALIEYHDTVYNFTFEGEDEGAYLVANGFYSGDLHMQNEKREKPERVFTAKEKEFIAEIMLHHEELKAKNN